MAFSRYGTDRAVDPGPRAAWRQQAACAGLVVSPTDDMWFPPDGEHGNVARVRERAAKRVCARCPVTQECLAFAVATGQQHGVWGGLGSRELAARRRAWRRARPAERVLATSVLEVKA